MIPEPVLNLAVQRGLIAADQVAALHALAPLPQSWRDNLPAPPPTALRPPSSVPMSPSQR